MNSQGRPRKEDIIGEALYENIERELRKKGFSEKIIARFLYICAEHSEMKKEFDDLYQHYIQTVNKNHDKRVKFTKADKRRIRKVFTTSGGYSVRKTQRILKEENIRISERYLYTICEDLRKKQTKEKKGGDRNLVQE